MQADKNAMGSTMRCLVMDALCKIPTMDIPTNVVNKFNNIIAPRRTPTASDERSGIGHAARGKLRFIFCQMPHFY